MARQVMTVTARDIKSRKTLGIPLNATAMEILARADRPARRVRLRLQGPAAECDGEHRLAQRAEEVGIEDFRFHDTHLASEHLARHAAAVLDEVLARPEASPATAFGSVRSKTDR
jgi:hypothetical protein